MLINKHSVDSIAGKAKKDGAIPKEKRLSTQTLYNYIDAGLLAVKNIDLPNKVGRRPSKQKIKKYKNNKVLHGLSILERPAEVETREEFGHF